MSVKNAVQSNFHNFFTEGCIEYIYEDEQCVAFDATKNQQAPTHFLVVPKKVIPRLSLASPEDEKILGHLLIVCRRVAKSKGLHPTGFRVIMNEGPQGGPTVDHLHFHVMGHRQMIWPFCHLLIVAKNIAKQKGLAGYHVVVDEDHRTVRFNGIHLFARSLLHMMWPTGPGCRL